MMSIETARTRLPRHGLETEAGRLFVARLALMVRRASNAVTHLLVVLVVLFGELPLHGIVALDLADSLTNGVD